MNTSISFVDVKVAAAMFKGGPIAYVIDFMSGNIYNIGF